MLLLVPAIKSSGEDIGGSSASVCASSMDRLPLDQQQRLIQEYLLRNPSATRQSQANTPATTAATSDQDASVRQALLLRASLLDSATVLNPTTVRLAQHGYPALSAAAAASGPLAGAPATANSVLANSVTAATLPQQLGLGYPSALAASAPASETAASLRNPLVAPPEPQNSDLTGVPSATGLSARRDLEALAAFQGSNLQALRRDASNAVRNSSSSSNASHALALERLALLQQQQLPSTLVAGHPSIARETALERANLLSSLYLQPLRQPDEIGVAAAAALQQQQDATALLSQIASERNPSLSVGALAVYPGSYPGLPIGAAAASASGVGNPGAVLSSLGTLQSSSEGRASSSSAVGTSTRGQAEDSEGKDVPNAEGKGDGDAASDGSQDASMAGPTQERTSGDRSTRSKRPRRPYRHESFVCKLHRIVTKLEADGRDDIMSFNDDESGGFFLHKMDVFESEIMPQYYRGRKFCTFRRQLTSYGFSRNRTGGAYTNPNFRRGRADLAARIQRDAPSEEGER